MNNRCINNMWPSKCFFTISGHLRQHFLCEYERFAALPSVGGSIQHPAFGHYITSSCLLALWLKFTLN